MVCAFVFDREIRDALADPADRRVEFIHASVSELQRALQGRGGGLIDAAMRQLNQTGYQHNRLHMVTAPDQGSAGRLAAG